MRKKKRDSVTGSIKQPLIKIILGGGSFFSAFIFLAAFLPKYSVTYLSIALPVGIIGITSLLWLNYQPNLWAKFLGFVSIGCLYTIVAIRSFDYLLPALGNIIKILVIATVIFSYSIPLWNLQTAKFLKGELSYTPKTKIGRFVLKISLSLLPMAGFIGAAIGLSLHRDTNNLAISSLILGPLCWLLALILPFSSYEPISSWENEKLKKTESQ
jgi:hypothetical protein